MTPQYVVSISGGMASAVAAERAIRRYGREAVTLWFADTNWEDEDLHRFLADCMQRWGERIEGFKDGRTPLEIAEQAQLIPNQKRAPCSLVLKVQPFRRYLAELPYKPTILLGMDWREQHRMAAPTRIYGEQGYTVDFPLLWKPLEYRPYAEVVRSWGIEPPRLYDMGFPHNNCGGRCVKQGIAEWRRLAHYFPERFAEVRDWEQDQRAKGGPRADYSIARDQSGGEVKPLTLAEIEQRAELEQPKLDDLFGCFCETV